MLFLEKHPSIQFDWETVKTKVMNERKERKRKLESRQNIFNVSI